MNYENRSVRLEKLSCEAVSYSAYRTRSFGILDRTGDELLGRSEIRVILRTSLNVITPYKYSSIANGASR